MIVSDCDCPAVCVAEPVTTKRVAAPTAIDTAPETPLLELCEVAVNVPLAALPVYVRPSAVKSATPALKSAALSRTFAPWSPETVPVSGTLAATVTWSPNALNDVTVLPKGSSAVRVLVPVNVVPFVCGLVSCSANFASEAGETETERASAPAALIVVEPPAPPSVALAVTVALSASTSRSEPPTVETPPVNVSVVGVPNGTAAAVLSVTVGDVDGAGEKLAPPNMIAWAPV